MVEEKSGFLLSFTKEDQGHKLFYSLYHPSDTTSIKATLLVLHGMMEHSGRYAEIARFLAKQGIAVLNYDHLGHGKTALKEEDLGFFIEKNAREQVVLDAENMADYLENKFPFVPHFLLGHSMGSFIARCLLQETHQRFDGAIIVGTSGKLKGLGVAKILVSAMNKFNPRKRSRLINVNFAKLNNSRFKAEPQQGNVNWLSVNTENRAAFLSDKLCGVPFTNNGYHTLVALNMDATKRDWAAPILKRFPLFFISGIDDPIGDFGKGIQKTVADLKSDGFNQVEMKLYENMRHEIFQETEKEMVFQDVSNWINKQLH